MGSCESKPKHPTAEEIKRMSTSRILDENLRYLYLKDREKIKLLLLGTGECGKTTILKQWRLIYGEELTSVEKREYIPAIQANIITSAKKLLEAVIESGQEKDLTNIDHDQIDMILEAPVPRPIQSHFSRNASTSPSIPHSNNISSSDVFTNKMSPSKAKMNVQGDIMSEETADAISRLWQDPVIKQVWNRKSELHIFDSASKFLDSCSRIAQAGYVPSDGDILNARQKTNCVAKEAFDVDGTIFEVIDVGGQRNERKKWIHMFDDITSIIFVAAISEYDQTLIEDSTTNRLEESLALFQWLVRSTFLKKCSICLFLNKTDIMKEKIKTSPINAIPAFSDYTGGSDYKSAIEYFQNKFLSVIDNDIRPANKIKCHPTNALDTSNVRVVLEKVKDTILRSALDEPLFSGVSAYENQYRARDPFSSISEVKKVTRDLSNPTTA